MTSPACLDQSGGENGEGSLLWKSLRTKRPQSLTKPTCGIIFPFMPDNLQDSLYRAILRLLRPLARLILNHGVAYGTFAELARKAFVEEGFDHLQRAGKRPTVSSVSALTGLTRKETKLLRDSSPIGHENRHSATAAPFVSSVAG